MTNQSDVPAAVSELEAIFHEHFEATVALSDVLGSITDRINAVAGCQHVSIKSEVRVDDFLHYDVDRYVRWVKRIAAETLSAPLAPFKADEIEVLSEEMGDLKEIARHCYGGDDHTLARRARPLLAKCSPLSVWRALKVHHNPTVQNRAAAEKQANALGQVLAPHLFSLYDWRRSKGAVEMKIVKGKVEVILNVQTEKNWSGTERELISSVDLRNFACAMDFALRQIHQGRTFRCGTGLMELADDYGSHRRNVVSRERIDLGDGVHIVIGHQRFKLYLPQDIAASINLFVAEYGSPVKC